MLFDPRRVRYAPDQTREFYRTIVERARQIPGANDAALSETIPFDGTIVAVEKIAPEGYQFPPDKQNEPVLCNTVDGRYFETMGTPVVRGRGFHATDTSASPRVVVINEVMASPSGRTRIRLANASGCRTAAENRSRSQASLTTPCICPLVNHGCHSFTCRWRRVRRLA